MDKKFDSAFLDPELKEMVDAVNASNFTQVKSDLIQAMNDGNRFKDGGKHVKVFESITNHRKLQKAFYQYILASEGMKIG